MLKKVATAMAVGAGFLAIGTPAFATEGGEVDDPAQQSAEHDHGHRVSVVNLENAELLSDINVCRVEVNVIAAPAFSDDDAGPCVNPDLPSADTPAEDQGELVRDEAPEGSAEDEALS